MTRPLTHIVAAGITTGRGGDLPDLAIDGLPFLHVGQRTPCMKFPDLFDAVADIHSSTEQRRHAADLDVIRQMCAACPVTDACAEYGTTTEQAAGIWGGLTGYDMRRARRGRAPIAECGTDSGYYRHLRTLGEPACEDCRAAHNTASATRYRRKKAAA